MHRTSFAVVEHVLRLLTSKERATSIIGDLVEVAPQKGTGWVWLSISKILLFLAWRPVLGVIFGLYAGGWVFGSFQAQFFGVYAPHRLPHSWIDAFGVITGATTGLIVVLPYAVLRYGVRDRLTVFAASWAGFLTLFLCEWWRPAVVAVCIALALGFVVLSISKRGWLRPLISLLVIVAAWIGSWFAIMSLDALLRYVIHPGPWGSIEVSTYRMETWFIGLLVLGAGCTIVAVFTLLHTWSSMIVSD
jgi:hypothetical protein